MEPYKISECRGSEECKNAISVNKFFTNKIERLFIEKDLLSFFKSQKVFNINSHNQFSVSISHCPNGCSRPQITDIGIIYGDIPIIDSSNCLGCGVCEKFCREHALIYNDGTPIFDESKCVFCGGCIDICPGNAINSFKKGFRLLIGGRLGRHPHLGVELHGILSEHQVLKALGICLDFFISQKHGVRRFADIVDEHIIDTLNKAVN